MANEDRIRQLAIGGLVEDNPLTSGATTLTSGALAAVSGGVGSTQYLAIVLDPDGNDGAPEIVHVTALTGGAGSATIARGKEGTSARQHDAGTPWVHAVTPYDVPKNVDIPWGGDLGYDYEFDGSGSSLPSGWSWVNQGSATYLERFGAGTITSDIAGGSPWNIIVRSISGSSWDAVAKLEAVVRSAANGYAGLIARDSSGTKFAALSCYPGSAPSVFVEKWNSPTSFNANVASLQIPMSSSAGRAAATYLRLRKNNATSYDFMVSPNGLAWFTIVPAVDLSAFLSIDQIGFGIVDDTTYAGAISCEWLRVR